MAALASLTPLAVDVADTLGESDWQPVFGVYLLAYALLVGLVVWQVTLAVRARRSSASGDRARLSGALAGPWPPST